MHCIVDSMIWRCDFILITDRKSYERHIDDFKHMAKMISSYAEKSVISFINQYQKVKRNSPEAREVWRVPLLPWQGLRRNWKDLWADDWEIIDRCFADSPF